MHGHLLRAPSLSPLDPVAIRRALELGPEAEVERGDEEDPVEAALRARVVDGEGLARAEMERVRPPRPGGIVLGLQPFVDLDGRSDMGMRFHICICTCSIVTYMASGGFYPGFVDFDDVRLLKRERGWLRG